jgi:hypothetical protein
MDKLEESDREIMNTLRGVPIGATHGSVDERLSLWKVEGREIIGDRLRDSVTTNHLF